jgi:UMF1 family MFS transporter
VKPHKKAIWGWALYDWANSAFATTVMAGFFPVVFKYYWCQGVDVNTSTARLGFANSAASLIVALIAPIVGAIADRGSARKRFLLVFAYWGVLSTACLFVIAKGQWQLAMLAYAMGIVGFSGSNIFYDALLINVAGRDTVDYVSGLGYALGYLGGGLLLLFSVVMTVMPQRFGLIDATHAMRVSFLMVAVWWAVFTLFIACWVTEERFRGTAGREAISGGFRQLIGTFHKAGRLKPVFLFLLAYWFYIDGVNTVVRMAVDYGLSLGFSQQDLILALLMVQFIGFPSAIAFGKLAAWWDVRKCIFLAIGCYAFIVLWATFMTSKGEFYFLAIVVGLVQGGIQALSRSYYSRLIPRDQAGEYYGFYNMMGRFAAIFGPALMGMVTLAARHLLMPPSPTAEQLTQVGQTAARWSIASLLLLFLFGAILFYRADTSEKLQGHGISK